MSRTPGTTSTTGTARGGGLHNRDPEAWHWSRTERFWELDPNAVFTQIAEVVCPEAVAMSRRRVNLGTLWSAEHERVEAERTRKPVDSV